MKFRYTTGEGTGSYELRPKVQGWKGQWIAPAGAGPGGEEKANLSVRTLDPGSVEERLLWELQVHTEALRHAIKRERAGEQLDMFDYRKKWWVAWHRLDNFHRNQVRQMP